MTQTVLLGDIATVQTGPFGSQLHQKDYVESGTPIVTVEHLGGDRMTRQNLPMVSDDDRERLKRYTLKEGDTVFSRVGSVDRASYVHEEEDGWMFSGRCLRVSPDPAKVNPRFLSFVLRSPQFTGYIKSVAVGATMPSINTRLLSSAPVILPDLQTQEQAASTLDSIEQKIELNRQMNETLEQMGQALFRHYFIDNPEAEKWEDGSFSNATEVLTGKGSVKSQMSEAGQVPLYGANGVMGTSEDYLYNEPLIITGRVGTLGKVRAVTGQAWYSDNVLIMRPKPGYYGYVLHIAKSFDYISMNRGSSQPLITQTDLRNRKIKLPDNRTLSIFESQHETLFEQQQKNEEQIQALTALRDTLLPRLISGKVKIT